MVTSEPRSLMRSAANMADGKGFCTPKRRLVIEKFSFADVKERYKRQIEEHPFNFAVEILVPDCSLRNVLQTVQETSLDKDAYCVIQLPVHAFTEVEFINTFLKNGQFLAVSWETHIDSGNNAAILPNGTLVLSLDKDTYEQLGLTGKPSVFQKKQRFIIEVNLTGPNFVPDKKLYKRVHWCLKERLQLTFKFLMTWTNQGQTSTSKLNSYFSSFAGQSMKNQQVIQRISNHKKAPIVTFSGAGFTPDAPNEKNDCNTSCDCLLFFEWLGCVACGVNCFKASPDSFVSRLTCPEPSQNLKEFVKCRWTGMITSNSILSLVHAARNLVQSRNLPWVSLTVWGFVDCPVTWKKNEHGYFLGGENFYTFVIFPGDQYWIYLAMGSHDVCS